MTVQLEKYETSMACLEGLPEENLFYLKKNMAALFKFAKLHLNKPKDF